MTSAKLQERDAGGMDVNPPRKLGRRESDGQQDRGEEHDAHQAVELVSLEMHCRASTFRARGPSHSGAERSVRVITGQAR